LEEDGTAQGEIRAVERRTCKRRRRNKKNICKKLEKVLKYENYEENGKGERKGKGVKLDKGQKTKTELLSFYTISFPSNSENHFIKKTVRAGDWFERSVTHGVGKLK
jgi:hypothetical protein